MENAKTNNLIIVLANNSSLKALVFYDGKVIINCNNIHNIA